MTPPFPTSRATFRAPRAHALAPWCAALAIALASTHARANGRELTITVTGFDSWPAAVATLQSDTTSEGRTIEVGVTSDDNSRVPCGGYTLTLDVTAASAFVIDRCNEATGTSTVRLVSRAALFAHDDIVPRPLAPGVSAIEVLTGGAAGGAGTSGGSDLLCSVSVRPYVVDMEHGTRVFLPPGRFQLRVLASDVIVERGESDWTLRGAATGSLTIDYDVVDLQRGVVVIHDRAILSCGTRGADQPPAQPVGAPATEQMPPFSASISRIDTAEPMHPMQPRFTLSAGGDILGVAVMNLAGVTFRGAGQTATGDTLGLATVGGYFVDVGLSFHCQGVYASATGSMVTGDVAGALDARVTLAGAVQTRRLVVYAGPAVRWSRYSVASSTSAAWNSDVITTLGVELGVRVQTHAWWYTAPNSRTGGAFHVSEIGLGLVAPITGGSWMVAVGGSFGIGM